MPAPFSSLGHDVTHVFSNQPQGAVEASTHTRKCTDVGGSYPGSEETLINPRSEMSGTLTRANSMECIFNMSGTLMVLQQQEYYKHTADAHLYTNRRASSIQNYPPGVHHFSPDSDLRLQNLSFLTLDPNIIQPDSSQLPDKSASPQLNKGISFTPVRSEDVSAVPGSEGSVCGRIY